MRGLEAGDDVAIRLLARRAETRPDEGSVVSEIDLDGLIRGIRVIWRAGPLAGLACM
jgi:hypothetical protein